MSQEINDLKENIFSVEHSLNQNYRRLKVICISALTLSIISFVLVILLVFTVFLKSSYDRAMSTSPIRPTILRASPSSTTAYPSSSSDSTEEDLERIQKASVIVYGKNVTKGKKLHCVLDEIWFKSKDADFTLKPGDKLPMMEHDVEPNTSYGQGQIVFFEGNPASGYCASWAVHRDKVSAFQHLGLDQVKQIIKAIKNPEL